jgi:hypothetical protein
MTLSRPQFHHRPLTTPDDLIDMWGEIVEGEPFRERRLWLVFVDGLERPVGPVLTIEDVPDGPYDVPSCDLVGWCRDILDGPGAGGVIEGAASVAILMSRPGGDPWMVSDRAWARFLSAAATEIGDPTWPVHWAHRNRIEQIDLGSRP